MKTELRTEPKVEVTRVEQDPGGDTTVLKSRIRILGCCRLCSPSLSSHWVHGSCSNVAKATQPPISVGAAAVALMTENGYHDNFSNKHYANPDAGQGSLERLVDSANNLGFSVEQVDTTFIGIWVVSAERRPASSPNESMSLLYMSADGTRIVRHLAY